MPELPEVETVVRDLKRGGLEGRRIQDVSLLWARTAATHAPEVFKRELKGRLIREVSRRAKFIVMRLEPGLAARTPAHDRPPRFDGACRAAGSV